MVNKHKLKGGKIFIKNDLSFKERKIQKKINRWVKQQKDKGEEINVGLGRVKVKGAWMFWAEIEKEKEVKISSRRGGC